MYVLCVMYALVVYDALVAYCVCLVACDVCFGCMMHTINTPSTHIHNTEPCPLLSLSPSQHQFVHSGICQWYDSSAEL